MILANGVNHVELGSNNKPPELVSAMLRDFRKKHRCHFVVHNYFPPVFGKFILNLADINENNLERSRSFVFNTLKLCHQIGAPFYSVHCGYRIQLKASGEAGWSPLEPETNALVNSYAESFHALYNSLQRICAYAAKWGVNVLVENQYNIEGKEYALMCYPKEWEQLLSTVKAPNLGVLLDMGHLNVAAHQSRFDPDELIHAVGSRLQAFHVHDNDGATDSHNPIQVGSWVLDVLRRPEFAKLPIIIESKFETVTDLRRHVDWLKAELGRE